MAELRVKMNVAIDTRGFCLAVDDEVPIAVDDGPGIPEDEVERWLLAGLARREAAAAPILPAETPPPAQHTAPGAVAAAPKPKRRRAATTKREQADPQ